MALKYIKELKEPTLKIINNVLSLNNHVNKKHFDLCVSLCNNPITLDLPLPHTNKVSNFSKIAGVENLERLRKSGKFIPGCYRIYKDSDLSNICYIGQAMHLGVRVKQHAKGNNKNTAKFCADLRDKGKVDLYILPSIDNLPTGLSIPEFLCVLEQYLIFKYRPQINRLYIARPGIVWTKEVIAKHREKVGKKIYMYLKSIKDNKLELIYIFDSASEGSLKIGKERSWIKNTLVRNKGWYKNTIYFSLVWLTEENIIDNGLSFKLFENIKKTNEIKPFINNILKELPKRSGKKVKITNINTGESIIYLSKKQAAKELKADPSSISIRNKLFRGIYEIEFL